MVAIFFCTRGALCSRPWQLYITYPGTVTYPADIELMLESVKSDIIKSIDEKLKVVTALQEENKALRNDLDKLKSVVDKQTNVIQEQQQFLNALDAKERSNNLVMLGVPEHEHFLDNTDDNAKVAEVLRSCGVQDPEVSIRRQGQLQADRSRPLLLTFKQPEIRQTVLEKKQQLKQDRNTVKIFVKEDTHPLIRKEWQRVNRVLKEAKDRAENADKEVVIKDGKVLVNGNVIDEFRKPGLLNFRQ